MKYVSTFYGGGRGWHIADVKEMSMHFFATNSTTIYAIQDRMRLMQRKTKFGPNRQTQKEICFHNFESESN